MNGLGREKNHTESNPSLRGNHPAMPATGGDLLEVISLEHAQVARLQMDDSSLVPNDHFLGHEEDGMPDLASPAIIYCARVAEMRRKSELGLYYGMVDGEFDRFVGDA